MAYAVESRLCPVRDQLMDVFQIKIHAAKVQSHFMPQQLVFDIKVANFSPY
jgi:hypothetical protein